MVNNNMRSGKKSQVPLKNIFSLGHQANHALL